MSFGFIRRTFLIATVVAFPFAIPLFAGAQSVIPEMTNLEEVVRNLRANEFKGRKFSRTIKVAVLDNGFNGWEAEKGRTLPPDTEYFPGHASDADKITDSSYHGLFMAQLLTAIIRKSGAQAQYKLDLYNAHGITKFKSAVKAVVEGGYDVVLYSQVWEFGGNGDGKGFVNAEVNKAVAAGVVWINAAGNFGRLTRRAPVDGKKEGENEWVVFKGKTPDGVQITCRPPPGQQCPLRLVLSWNDFKDDADAGTDKDLDLFLYDKTGKLAASSERHQKVKVDDEDKLASIVPRELIETNLSAGTYKARVKIKSQNFSPSQDELRITVSNPGVELSEPSIGETILPPADNPGVIAVGASDDVQTSTSKKLGLPHLYLKSVVKLKDGSAPFSTSNAASMAAALTVLHLGTGVEKSRDAVLAKLKAVTRKPEEKPDYSSVPVAPQPGSAPGGAHKPPPRRPPVVPRDAGDVSDGRGYNPERPYTPGIGMPPQTPYIPTGPDDSYAPVPPRPRSSQQAYFPGSFGTQPCERLRALPFSSPYAEQILSSGGAILVSLSGRLVVSVNYDFAEYVGVSPGPGQRIFITPRGVRLLNQQQVSYGLPPDYIEVISSGIAVCR